MSYTSLHNHTDMSFQDGFSKAKDYFETAKKLNLKGLAITEHGNLISAPYIQELKAQYPDIKVIYGAELYECFDIRQKDKDNKYFHLIALCKNEAGRKGLNEIITVSNFDGFYYKPRIDLSVLKPHAENLIVLSACLASKLAREPEYQKCIEYINEYKSVLPNFYLEMQSHDTAEQAAYNKKVLQLAHDTQTEFLITTDSHAAAKDDLYYQARHVQVARDSDTLSESYTGCYIQTALEIHGIMDGQIGYENVEIGLETTNKLLGLIDDVNIPFSQPILPDYPLPKGFNDNTEYLKHLITIGWKNRNIDRLSADEIKKRKERLGYELSVICKMKYDGYFLIVWDFINWAKNNDVIVGDGRGSAGGSFVCYLLEISSLDPVTYDLIFERFLNPERISMPDIDVDFADKEKVIKYLTTKYGVNKVCQIMNLSEITPCVAIKDTARVLGIPYTVADKISKRFTYDTFKECIENNPSIYKEYPDCSELFDIAEHLSGKYRFTGLHAGGVGIVNSDINDYMPMKLGTNGEHIIQVDKKMAEKIGIVKFDILGLSTLSIIQEVKSELNIDDWTLDPNNPDFINDAKTYELLCSGKTNGVFQVESQGMKDLLLRLQPSSLNDMSAVLALYRPDSMSMLEDYIYYKHHQNEVTYLHSDMMPILEKTFGSIIYQEQIMDIVRVFGGRTYGGADKFRKGIGSKNTKLIIEETEKLQNEIIENGYSAEISEAICEQMKKYGGYCFNFSHSILYAVISLRTAYLKAHYPEYFFCALLNQNKNDYGMINKYIIDAKSFNVRILPPNINKSSKDFKVVEGQILFGLGAIKGIGEKFTDDILSERDNGSFKGFNDFLQRVLPQKSQIISLIKSGAIPCKSKREFLIKYARSLFELKAFKAVNSIPSQKVLLDKYGLDFSDIEDKTAKLQLYNQYRRNEHESRQQRSFKEHMDSFAEKYLTNEQFWEFETLSVFISDNPFEQAYRYISQSFEEVSNESNGVTVGIIADVTKKKDRNGKQFAFINLYSAFGILEITCWHSQYKQYEDLIKRGSQVAVLFGKNNDNVTVRQIKSYRQWLIDRGIGDFGGVQALLAKN